MPGVSQTACVAPAPRSCGWRARARLDHVLDAGHRDPPAGRPVRSQLLAHGRPGHRPVHRQPQSEHRLLRVLAGRARVRRRGREQVVVPRSQRTGCRRDQHRHARRPVPQRPAPLRRGLRDRGRAARLVRRSTAPTGGPPASCATRASLVHRGRRALPGLAVRADRRRLPAGTARRGRHDRPSSGRRPRRGRLRRARPRRVDLACGRALDRPDDRGSSAAHPCGVEDGPGHRRPGPRLRRPGPGRGLGAIAGADREPGRGCCCTARSSPAPTGARRSSSSRPPPTRSPRWWRWPTGSPSGRAR